MDCPLGAILGATLLTFLPEWLRDLKKLYLVIYGCTIILVIVFMPEGLWGFGGRLGAGLYPRKQSFAAGDAAPSGRGAEARSAR